MQFLVKFGEAIVLGIGLVTAATIMKMLFHMTFC